MLSSICVGDLHETTAQRRAGGFVLTHELSLRLGSRTTGSLLRITKIRCSCPAHERELASRVFCTKEEL